MKNLWTPWRMKFVMTYKKPKHKCFFCYDLKDKPANDKTNLILFRGKQAFVLLNLYPYSNGHLMVAPLRHTADYPNLSKDELSELNVLVQKSVLILKKVYRPEGFNIGINLGKAAGAGVDSHLHVHIVPRWLGDINFMPVMAEIKVMPETLAETYKRLKPEFKKLKQ